jgi:hypothetical protein
MKYKFLKRELLFRKENMKTNLYKKLFIGGAH